MLAEEGAQLLVHRDREPTSTGCRASFRAAAADAATARGLKGKWVVLNTRSSIEPFLANATSRPLREKAWRMFVSRGDHGDAHDNKKVDRRDPGAARRAGPPARLPDPRPLAHRGLDGQDARSAPTR